MGLVSGAVELEDTEEEIVLADIKTGLHTYCECASLSTFNGWIRRGIIPPAVPGTTR